ncbi:MAG: cytochrome b [Hyphomicrobiaceae bacterium]|nr:cytochrome b [Hyphomicrobiaceae bacterium]
MRLLNSPLGYGVLTRLLHWLMAGLMVFQFAAASVMTRLGPEGLALGLPQSAWYNWHKSIGLVALLVAVARLANRRLGELPPWAEALTEGERSFIHRAEQVLYTMMIAMPVSGFLYVVAGGYGVHLFGVWHLPDPLGRLPSLAAIAKWVHILSGWLLLGTIAAHVGLVLRHQLLLRDGLLWRMLWQPEKE